MSNTTIADYPATTSDRNLTINADIPFDDFEEYYILYDEGKIVKLYIVDSSFVEIR